tara:strand:+ start:1326 stop:2111 length:786 start_codon:yes stop_codon:yes gene_type:complete
MNVTILFFSTNRLDYLMPTLRSFHSKINFEGLNLNKIFIDDYPLGRNDFVFNNVKDNYNFDELVLHTENKGQSVTWKEAWEMVPKDTDYIWHQEDDFTFPEEINVQNLINILESFPRSLSQICLKRQVWYENDNDFIEQIEEGKIGKEIEININNKKEYLILHQHYFNANPCIYPRWVIEEKYSHNPQESVIASDLKQRYGNTVYSSIYGKKLDKPLCEHIGYYNQGCKVEENAPGWDWLKHYDPSKKYHSKKYLKEFNNE